MKLELNTNGAWRTVLSGLGRESLDAEDQLNDAKTAAAMLAIISASKSKRPIAWRLTSEADGRVIERCEGDHGWMDVAYDPERTA
jgi:hypothetical protein